ncbi:hypothetical protein CDAR_235051 [Caerostris darwini]|uniref:RNase H type-1 domain-containing protein n=1 Tax=Caerostris darwini TaxID=1538125 RepID=A0AAV4US70_9ARAC|nr:hypothetical protein CDAR_235051 [Caerostris darwini]
MAELHAIKKAIEYIINNSINSAKIISNSRSILIALDNPANNSPAILQVKELLNNMPSTIEMVWTKAHIGVNGNELADTYAKLGTEKTVTDSFHRLPTSFIKKKLNEINKSTWQQQWSTSNKQPTCGGVVLMSARAAHVHGARAWGCVRYWAGIAAQHCSSADGWLRPVRPKSI